VIRKYFPKRILFGVSLIFLFLVALFLRFYRLDQNVPPLYADESGGHYLLFYQVVNNVPNFFANLYNKIFIGTFSLTWLFGLTPLGVRAASAIYGSLGVITIYFFAKRIKINSLNSYLIALLSAAIVTLSPWSFNLSRLGHTHIPIVVLLVSLHFYFYLKAKKIYQYFLSLLPLLLTLLYYPSTVILVTGGLLPVLIETWKLGSKKQKLIAVFVVSLCFITTATAFVYRFKGLSILSRGLDLAIWRDVNVTADSNLYRGLARFSTPSLFSFNLEPEVLGNKLVYNYPISIINVFTRNYLSFFSPDFLFLRGDLIMRHSTSQVGAFLPFLLPFMIFGAFKFFQNANRKTKNLILIWILISPLPAALTKDGAGYILRAVTLMPILSYFSALGLISFFNLIRQKLFKCLSIFILIFISLFSAYYYFYGYFHVYPALSVNSFEFGFKELSDFQQINQNKSLLIIWDGFYPKGQFRFWQRTNYQNYLKFTPQEVVINNSIFYQTYENLYFSLPKNIVDLKNFLNEYHPQYIVFPESFLINNSQYRNLFSNPIKIINCPDQTPAFIIYQN